MCLPCCCSCHRCLIPGGTKIWDILNTGLGLPCLLKHSYLHPDHRNVPARMSVAAVIMIKAQYKQTNKHLWWSDWVTTGKLCLFYHLITSVHQTVVSLHYFGRFTRVVLMSWRSLPFEPRFCTQVSRLRGRCLTASSHSQCGSVNRSWSPDHNLGLISTPRQFSEC